MLKHSWGKGLITVLTVNSADHSTFLARPKLPQGHSCILSLERIVFVVVEFGHVGHHLSSLVTFR